VKGAPVTVPKLLGMNATDAFQNVASAGLKAAGQWDASSTRPAGIVLLQRPNPGEPVAPGAEVILTIAGPPPIVRFPNVRVLDSIRVFALPGRGGQ